MTAQLNLSLLEQVSKKLYTGQISIFDDFLDEIKLINIPVEQWISLEFIAVYWTHILSSNSEMLISRLKSLYLTISYFCLFFRRLCYHDRIGSGSARFRSY